MKIRNIIWAILLAGLFGQPTLAQDTPAVKAKAAEMKLDALPKVDIPAALSPTVTRYEITIDPKVVKDDEALINLRAKLENSEVFRGSECVREDPCSRAEGKKKKNSLRYICTNVSCTTDDLFRGPAAQQGFQTMAFSIAVNPATGCPSGCKKSTNCTLGSYVTCCKNPGTGQYCPGYAP